MTDRTTVPLSNEKCDHEPDFRTAQVVCHADEGFEVGITCQKCGEDGFLAIVTPDDIEWNDED